jgi:nicotinate phosphoribosyltransferase
MLEIREYARKELSTLWDEYKRLSHPHIYKVDLSQKLYDLKHSMIVGA